MRGRSLVLGIVAALAALALAAGPAAAGGWKKGHPEVAVIVVGQPAPVVVQPAPGLLPPPVLVFSPPPPVLVVQPAPVVVVRQGPPYGHAWGHWKHHWKHGKHHGHPHGWKHVKTEWND